MAMLPFPAICVWFALRVGVAAQADVVLPAGVLDADACVGESCDVSLLQVRARQQQNNFTEDAEDHANLSSASSFVFDDWQCHYGMNCFHYQRHERIGWMHSLEECVTVGARRGYQTCVFRGDDGDSFKRSERGSCWCSKAHSCDNERDHPKAHLYDSCMKKDPTGVGGGDLLTYDSDFCVSVDHNRFEDGAKLQLYECLNGDGQFWEFPTAYDPPFENFWVTPGYAKEFCAAIEGDRNYNGAKLELQRCDPNNLAHQWFERRHTFPRDWDVGTKVSFANAKYSDKCFVVDGNKAKNLQRLQIWSCDHSDSQAFIVN